MLALVVVVVARSIPMNREEILAFGGLAAVLAVPVIWSHTLLLTLPLQVLALRRAATRRRGLPGADPGSNVSAWLRYEGVFVVLAVLALQLTEGAGAIDDQSLWLQLPVLVVMMLAGPALMAYVLATRSEAAVSPTT